MNREPPTRPVTLSRREVLLGTTTLLTAGGVAYTATRPAHAQADVTQDELAVSNAEYSSETGDIYTVWAAVTGSYSFQLNDPASGWRVRLFFSSNASDWELVAADGGPIDAASATGEYAVKAPLIDHSAFTADSFDAPLGETVETDAYVKVVFAALDSADTPLVEASAADSVVVRVSNTSVEAVAHVSGSGQTGVQVGESDDAPV